VQACKSVYESWRFFGHDPRSILGAAPMDSVASGLGRLSALTPEEQHALASFAQLNNHYALVHMGQAPSVTAAPPPPATTGSMPTRAAQGGSPPGGAVSPDAASPPPATPGSLPNPAARDGSSPVIGCRRPSVQRKTEQCERRVMVLGGRPRLSGPDKPDGLEAWMAAQSIMFTEDAREATHVIDTEARTSPRVLTAIARGCAYLVTPDWLTQSFARGAILDEIDFCIQGVFPDSTVTPRGINENVRHRPLRLVLQDKSVYTRRAFKGMPRDELAMIVEAAGARMLGSMPPAGDMPSGSIVVGDPGHKLCRSAGASDAVAVDIQWIRDAVLAVGARGGAGE